jgi:hypothetical protein
MTKVTFLFPCLSVDLCFQDLASNMASDDPVDDENPTSHTNNNISSVSVLLSACSFENGQSKYMKSL